MYSSVNIYVKVTFSNAKTKFFSLRATLRKNQLVINPRICKLPVIKIKLQFLDIFIYEIDFE